MAQPPQFKEGTPPKRSPKPSEPNPPTGKPPVGKEAAAALPSPQEAYQTLFDGVHQRVYFHKLASLRPEYMPRTPQQAEYLLKIAGDLRMAVTEDVVKQAAAASDPFAAASAALDRQLAGFPGFQKAAAQEEEVSVKNAAAAWMEDPAIYNSVLALKAHEAEQLLAQMQPGQ